MTLKESLQKHEAEFEFKYAQETLNNKKVWVVTIYRSGVHIYTTGLASTKEKALENIIMRNLYHRENPELWEAAPGAGRKVEGIPTL